MDQTQDVTGQYWKVQFETNIDGKDYYRLRSIFGGSGRCLESNATDIEFKNGAAYMDDCQDVSGQLWTFEYVRTTDGIDYYRF